MEFKLVPLDLYVRIVISEVPIGRLGLNSNLELTPS
jgi:hypothetical protein